MKTLDHPGGAEALWRADLTGRQVALAWLGQAGFAVRLGSLRMLIDPYLSDFLAQKYAGKELAHVRMIPPPLDAPNLRDLDLVLCTHRHSDHMDYGCLSTLAANNSACRFVVPQAEIDSALKAGLTLDRLLPAGDGQTIPAGPQAEVLAIPSAHETLATDEQGNHRYLGYVLRLAGLTLYHSGDCVVYPGQAERLREIGVDLALLPVNGRNQRLTARGVPGNMTFDEAAALCRQASIRTLIPHHFGMFDFNTVDLADLERQAAGLDYAELTCVIPRINLYYALTS